MQKYKEQLNIAIKECTLAGIVFLDLRPENVLYLVKNDEVKILLIDFEHVYPVGHAIDVELVKSQQGDVYHRYHCDTYYKRNGFHFACAQTNLAAVEQMCTYIKYLEAAEQIWLLWNKSGTKHPEKMKFSQFCACVFHAMTFRPLNCVCALFSRSNLQNDSLARLAASRFLDSGLPPYIHVIYLRLLGRSVPALVTIAKFMFSVAKDVEIFFSDLHL